MSENEKTKMENRARPMDKEKVVEFMKTLGCEEIGNSAGSDWVKGTCPLTPWFHKDPNKKQPSFGIKAATPANTYPEYHCFECDMRGPLPRLMHDLQWCSNRHFKEASRIMMGCDLGTEEKPTRGRRRIIASKEKHRQALSGGAEEYNPVPPEVLEQYPLVNDVNSVAADEITLWLTEKKKITVQLIAQFRLRIYVEPYTGRVGVVYPVYDRSGENLMDMWVQMIDKEEFFRLTPKLTKSESNYHEKNLWFGNQFLETGKPVILVSNSLGVLRLRSLGVKTALGLIEKDLLSRKLLGVRSPVVYVAFDGDSAGRQCTMGALAMIVTSSRYYLDWGVAGVKTPSDLESIAQFKRVFENRRKIAYPKPDARKLKERHRGKKIIFLSDKFNPFKI